MATMHQQPTTREERRLLFTSDRLPRPTDRTVGISRVNCQTVLGPDCMMMTSTPQVVAQPGQPLFTKSTKFNDLPDNVKKTFEDIEYVNYRCYIATLKFGFRAHIQGRVQISKDLKQRKVGEEATKGQDLIRKTHKVSRLSYMVSHLEPSH